MSATESFTYIDIAAVDAKTKLITGAREIETVNAPSRARQIVRNGDVIVSTVRPNLNAVALVPPKLDGAVASTGFCVLRPGSHLNSEYLFHWVRSSRFVEEMVRQATGQSYPAISDRIVKGSSIPVFDIVHQERIAAILGQAETLRAKRRDAIALLDALAQSVFLDMFGDPFVNSSGFEVCELEDLVADGDRINYGVVQPGQHVEGGIPLIRSGDLGRLGVDRSSLMRISPDVESGYARSRIKGNEILIGCVGAIGEVAVVSNEDVGSNIARAVARVPIAGDADREYVAAYLRMDFAQQYFTRELRTVAQPTLNIKQIKSMPVMFPPSSLRSEFAERVRCVTQQRVTQVAHLAALDELFTSLQHRAFSGMLWDHEATGEAA
ncbi:restriction endonuclease subunit S [Streptomyces sp. MBT84]|uniref:restriction endonuclease subunit S n=1 Tax=Streptomyces sp. MBT84 TaxID=1488414 RepID=UPI001C6E8187|nr:restriction endonuclease subunit S [Streptomyces sp. MBT84]